MFGELSCEWLRKHTYTALLIGIIIVVLTLNQWLPRYFNISIPESWVASISTAIAMLLVHRLHDDMKNPKLILGWDYYEFREPIRVYAMVKNMEGREAAREAKAMITIKEVKEGKERNLTGESLCSFGGFQPLVSLQRPIVEDELVPWAVPKTPPDIKGKNGITLKHKTTISSGQINRAVLFDVMKSSCEIKVFSEYGTEIERRQPPHNYIRCGLKPGHYRVRVRVVADRAFPVKGELEIKVEEEKKVGKILFIKPKEEPIILSCQNHVRTPDCSEVF